MASLIPGYEYEIFISYRQKDNKYDGWVTEFVDNLKRELEATFKEDVSVYFDINPHDGLLETHDVDASLREKLNCLIFIPIISRTYCDPKSFAWEHEFKAFVELASQDQFGLKVKLPNGNVASRVLPVRIHDLDAADIKECESVLGGVLRGIEFIYKSAGVNRPLRSTEEKPHENLNKTIYRDQINKVALAIKDIITAIEHPGQKPEGILKEVVKTKSEKANKLIPKTIVAPVIVLALIVLGYFFFPKIFKPSKHIEKSIAVLPFRNDTPNDSTTYFMDGVMEEVLNNLQSIKDLRVISRNSVEQYRNNTTKSTPEIAKALGVNYIVEGSGQKYGNSFRLRVQLIKAAKEGHLWGKSYEKEIKFAKDIFSIQSEIAQAIATQLEAAITPREKQLIEKTHTANLEAYDAYHKGEFYRKIWTQNDLETAMKYYKIALEKDPEYAQAYCGIAYVWMIYAGQGYLSQAEASSKEYAALMSAQKLDSALAEVHYGFAIYKMYTEFDWKGSESEYQKAIRINPNYAEAHAYYSHLLNILGNPEEAMQQIELALKQDPYNPLIKGLYGVDLLFVHRYNDAITVSREALKTDSTLSPGLTALMLSLHMTGRYDEALELWKTDLYLTYPGLVHAFDQGYAKAGYIGALSREADTLLAQSKTTNVNPDDLYWLYVCCGNKERALDYLERCYEVHDPNLIYLSLPVFDCLHNEPRYQALCRKMNLPLE
jgi:TolB-like protein/Tfp pilus assembly protein PilF